MTIPKKKTPKEFISDKKNSTIIFDKFSALL